MPGESLLEAAGQNFKQSADTTIESQRAGIEKERVQQEPGTQAGKEISDRVATAMGDKAKMKEIQEQSAADIRLQLLKGKMGETDFPAELAIQMAKDFKDPSILQMSNVPMNNKMMGAWIAEKYKAAAKTSQPRFNGNLMITKDLEGNETITDLRKFGFVYKPSGKGSDSQKITPAERQKFISHYERIESSVRSDQNAFVTDKNNAELKARIDQNTKWLQDNRPDYTQALQMQKEGGGIGGEGKSSPEDKAGSGSTLDEIWNAANQ